MRLVVDSNILFAALIKDSATRRIFYHLNAELFIISFSSAEIKKYKNELLEKSHTSEIVFDLILEQLTKKCIFVDDEIIKKYFDTAKEILWHIDPKDTPFIAAALATGADIWSDDEHFTKQKKIKVWKTADLVKLL